jgi:hypothetical protein
MGGFLMFNENDIDKIIKDGLGEIDKEIQQEEDIDKRAASLSKLLDKNRRVKVEYNDDVYDTSLKTTRNKLGEHIIMLMAASHSKMQQAFLMNRQYTPAIYTGVYNDNYTLEENINTVVKTFLGHVTGNFRVEALADEGDVTIIKERKER